ncbi:plexin domain-containing protein 2 [Bicyclus anynana]|uniref:Plexin domain-containing protein 2 n=1 Tax=Bicyclus anynana TaxID=110368 RepID=A0A6J1MYJ2_BICAN|nr:plexin domain-containing protein 2 [Bicyclus anynana]
MNIIEMKARPYLVRLLFILSLAFTIGATVDLTYTGHIDDNTYNDITPEFVSYTQGRQRRDVNNSSVPATNATTNVSIPSPSSITPTNNSAPVINTTIETSSLPPSAINKLLGVNGSGILHVDVNVNTPKVSDPIAPDDTTNDVFKETPETIKAEHNISNLSYDNHNFYNSTFIGDPEYFKQYWANITLPKANIHDVLSNSHRRATTIKASFPFPFYGHPVANMTVATGGFIYMGDHVHNWLAATQYIAPLMANFDTTLTNDSCVKMNDDGEKFTVFWENATLRQDIEKKFTFAVTLYKNGDIIFAYKDIPLPLKDIIDSEHPVKVGISDAYLTDKFHYHVRRKTIYEYHRVSFKNYEITNNTILKLVALPTCLQYDSCQSCANHETGFKCLWCDQIQVCSSGTDRNKQDWILRHCDTSAISNETACPASTHVDAPDGSGKIVYTTDTRPTSSHDTAIVTTGAVSSEPAAKAAVAAAVAAGEPAPEAPPASSSAGGVVGAFVAVALVCSLAAWVLYAFKNPHTRSGQLLIKYRPSTWSWRRGEARYTAATIHM